MPVGDAAFGQVIRRQLDRHLVARQYLDEILAHFARQVSEDFVAFSDLYSEGGVRQGIRHDSLDGNHIVFRDSLTPLAGESKAGEPKKPACPGLPRKSIRLSVILCKLRASAARASVSIRRRGTRLAFDQASREGK